MRWPFTITGNHRFAPGVRHAASTAADRVRLLVQSAARIGFASRRVRKIPGTGGNWLFLNQDKIQVH